MATLIGKKITVSIGGTPPKKDPDEIIGSETSIHLSEEEARKYDCIVGEQITLNIGSEIDALVQQVLETIKQDDEPNKQEIIDLSESVLQAQEQRNKISLTERLIATGANISSIASLIIQLSQIIS